MVHDSAPEAHLRMPGTGACPERQVCNTCTSALRNTWVLLVRVMRLALCSGHSAAVAVDGASASVHTAVAHRLLAAAVLLPGVQRLCMRVAEMGPWRLHAGQLHTGSAANWQEWTSACTGWQNRTPEDKFAVIGHTSDCGTPRARGPHLAPVAVATRPPQGPQRPPTHSKAHAPQTHRA